jgi:hypothetical protein
MHEALGSIFNTTTRKIKFRELRYVGLIKVETGPKMKKDDLFPLK